MFNKRKRSSKKRVDFEEILFDASNILNFNQYRLEGKKEKPIKNLSLFLILIFYTIISFGFLVKIFILQVVHGEEYEQIAKNNRLNEALIIAERGVVYDRRGELLIWNEADDSGKYDFPKRAYTDRLGLGQVLGYVSYPKKDKRGFFYRTDYLGRSGVELAFNDVLKGVNGKKIVEQNALLKTVSEFALKQPKPGKEVMLSIDAELSEAIYKIIATSSKQAGFKSGAAVIMDVDTGEILALTSFPSFDPEVMADGDDLELIRSYNEDDRLPFLNKVISGVYTPGSVVKPFMAYAALENHIIDPNRKLFSNGTLRIPNPYNPSNPSLFRDWRAHGFMDMREAIAFSSNIYFYIVGGGLPEIATPQANLDKPVEGIGITKMVKNFKRFGFGQKTNSNLAQEQAGTVPSPAWKKKVFNDDWRLGDTYFTSIGQFGFLVTPIQLLRAYGALANGGYLVNPHILKGVTANKKPLNLNKEYLKIIHEGMRMTVNYPGGTARSLQRSDVAIAAKSGTAEIGKGNAFVNSWAAGFWPYEKPKYAFVLMMHKAPRSNHLGATTIMGKVIDWMAENRPEYLGLDKVDMVKSESKTQT